MCLVVEFSLGCIFGAEQKRQARTTLAANVYHAMLRGSAEHLPLPPKKDVQRCSQYVKDLMSSGVCFLLTMQKQCEREQCKLAYSCRVLPVFAFLIAKLRHSRVALSVSVRFRRI